MLEVEIHVSKSFFSNLLGFFLPLFPLCLRSHPTKLSGKICMCLSVHHPVCFLVCYLLCFGIWLKSKLSTF